MRETRPLGESPSAIGNIAESSVLAGPPRVDIDRPRVLVADDNADLREYLQRLLLARYDVEAVADGKAALEAVRRNPPQLILTDVMMPKVDGFGLVKAIRSDVNTQAIPVIMLSARAGEEALIEGLEAGADDYLIKPFGGRELMARVASQLELARVRVENDRRKDEFLAMLAHELRNPLAAIANAVQITKLTNSAEDHKWSREVIEIQSKNLTAMIDDLLDVSRITRGKIQIRKQIVNVVAIVNSAVAAARPLIEERKHRLIVDLAPDQLHVDADPTRLEQIIVNLLNNAAKYTESSEWHHARRSGRWLRCVIKVEDTGIGMTTELLSRIFDLFVQGDQTIARSEGGLGIGLTLVKKLVEIHGGSVDARSEGPGQGSCLTVRLPLAILRPAESQTRVPRRSGTGDEALEGSSSSMTTWTRRRD